MILIADCGSTKTHWCLVEKGCEGQAAPLHYYTPGMNAVMLTGEEMEALMKAELLPQLGDKAAEVTEIHFYGAGCLGDQICSNVRRALLGVFPTANDVEVDTDLLGASRALLGRRPGIACIMGTGSNSCYYDGQRICDNVSPLGYILGDEGSGAVLGKLLVGDVLKRQLPDDLCQAFHDKFGLERIDIIRRVYKEPAGNRFLASLSPFLLEHIDRREIKDLVDGAFRAFFVRNIRLYPQARNCKVGFIGSIAHYYRERLAAVVAGSSEFMGYPLQLGEIIKDPMDSLVRFHLEAAD